MMVQLKKNWKKLYVTGLSTTAISEAVIKYREKANCLIRVIGNAGSFL
jgi:hypothetical protein